MSVATRDRCEYHDDDQAADAMPGDQYNGLQVRLDQCKALGRFVYVGNLPGKRGFGAPREPWSMNQNIEKLNAAYKKIAEESRPPRAT